MKEKWIETNNRTNIDATLSGRENECKRHTLFLYKKNCKNTDEKKNTKKVRT